MSVATCASGRGSLADSVLESAGVALLRATRSRLRAGIWRTNGSIASRTTGRRGGRGEDGRQPQHLLLGGEARKGTSSMLSPAATSC